MVFKSNVFKCSCGHIWRTTKINPNCPKCGNKEIAEASPEEKNQYNRQMKGKSETRGKPGRRKAEVKIEENNQIIPEKTEDKEFDKPAEQVEMKKIDIDTIIEANKVYQPGKPAENKIIEPVSSGFKISSKTLLIFGVVTLALIIIIKRRRKIKPTVERIPEQETESNQEETTYYNTPSGFD